MMTALHAKSGFTLIELLVVAILTVALSLLVFGFDYRQEDADTEREAFAQDMANLISSVRIESLVGKAVPIGGSIVVPDEVRVQVRTGSVTVVYYSGGTVIGTGQTLAYPFRNNPDFEIGGLRLSDRGEVATDVPAAEFDVVYARNDVSFTGNLAELSAAVSADISVWYRGVYRTVSIDRRANRVDVRDPCLRDWC